MKLGYGIVFVSDMRRSVEFYRDALGLPLGFESSHWTEFSTEGATLALHLSEAAAEGETAAAQERAGSCRPGFKVPDLDAFHRKLVDHGVTCVEEPRDVFGNRVGLYLDPDGLPISVGEG